MNNSIKILLGTAVAGLLYSFLKKKKAALTDLKFTKIDIAIDLPQTQNFGYAKLFYKIKLGLLNEAGVSINIKSIEAKVFLNGIEFAEINSTLKTIIEAKSTKTINIDASVNSINIINSIIDIITAGKANIKVKGSLLTDLGLIEFSKETIV